MNGATTDPCVNTMSAPISTIVIIKGANQYFLRTFRKSQMSLMRSRNASILQKMRVLFLRIPDYLKLPTHKWDLLNDYIHKPFPLA